jgi:hypothetical protein
MAAPLAQALAVKGRCAARNMPPVISAIVMLRFFARRQRPSMSAYFTNSLTPPTGLGLLASPLAGGVLPGRAARGSVAPRKMACPPVRGETYLTGSRPSTRAQGRGQPDRCPFQSGAEMDAKTRDSLILLAALSLICAPRLVCGSCCFCLRLLCAWHSRRPPRRTPEAPELTFFTGGLFVCSNSRQHSALPRRPG